jgi:carboxylesterase type B
LGTTVALALSFWHKDSILAFAIPSGSQVDIVNTGYVRYQGNRTLPNTVAYLGIPYAEPPVGNLRFRAPLPLNTTRVVLESAGKTIDATEYPEFCIQGTTGGGDAGGAGSEDCLKVNIYAPPDATKGSKREDFYVCVPVSRPCNADISTVPVLFYIHGGGRDLTTPLHCTTGLLQHQDTSTAIRATGLSTTG